LKIAAFDSGSKGGIAILDQDAELIDTLEMTVNDKYPIKHIDSKSIKDFINLHQPEYIFVELVTGKEGGRGQNTKTSLFVQGGYYHQLGDILYSLGCSHEKIKMIKPVDWKKSIGVSGAIKGDRKEKTKQLVKELYKGQEELYITPRGRVMDGVTDAIGIACAGIKYLKSKGVV